MRRTIFAAVIVAAVALSASPVAAVPKSTFDVPVDCPSGSQTIRFVDAQGSIVGFDEQSRPVLAHVLDVTFSVTADIGGREIHSDSLQQSWTRGKGKGLAGKLEDCTIDFDLINETFFVDEEFAAGFEDAFGTDVLFDYIGESVHLVTNLSGSVGMTAPGR